MQKKGVPMKEYCISDVSNATPTWVEENGIIRTSVISDGTTGKDWIKRLESKGCSVSIEAKKILCSPCFTPTFGVKTNLAVFRSMLLHPEERYTVKVHDMALLRGLAKPGIEVTCLLREKISREWLRSMDFWWIAVIHTPVLSFENNFTLCIDRYDGEDWLDVHGDMAYDSWDEEGGFAFEIPS